MQFPKPATTIDQQIQQLQSRGMLIPDSDLARHYLRHISYYRLSGYWLPFEADHTSHRFTAGTSFQDVLDLYIFDRELRLLTMDAIERIETSVRTQWMTTLVQQHGPHAHLDAAHFSVQKNKIGEVVWDHAAAVVNLKKECNRSKEPFIKHFCSKYEEDLPPLWAMCELMTFGEFSKWLSQTRESAIRNHIARPYDLDEKTLCSFIHHLSIIRNFCAHHVRLWNREIGLLWALPTKNPATLVPQFNRAQPKTIYNTVIMMAYLMRQINPGSEWKQRVREHLGTLPPSFQPALGLPAGWDSQTPWSRPA